MFKVETFKDPVVFYNQIQVGMDELHITSVPTLAMHMKGLGEPKQKWNIWIYHHFYNALYPKWNDISTKLEQKRLIRSLIKAYRSEWENHTTTLLKQVERINETFRELVELDLEELKDLKDESELVKCYKKLYGYYLKQPKVKQYREELHQELTPEMMASRLNRYNEIKLNIPRQGYPDVKRIYIYNMNYMDMKRVRFFEKLSQAGYEVIFRIPYSEEYRSLHKCWEKLYTQFVPKEEWQSIQDEVVEKTSALKNFLEAKSVEAVSTVKLFSHDAVDPVTFKRYLSKNPMDRTKMEYIGCQDDLLNEYFRDEMDTSKQIKHFYETPLGRFISALYQLKVEEHSVVMDFNTFITMMCSGIVTLNQDNKFITGKKALGLLNELKPYMEGIQSLEDILQRLVAYKALDDRSNQFEVFDQDAVEHSKVKGFLLNPFRAFGFVHNGQYEITVEELIKLGDRLKQIIHMLLVEQSPLNNMSLHIEMLKKLLIESKMLEEIEDLGTRKSYQRFFSILNTQLANTEIEDLADMEEYIVAFTSMNNQELEGMEDTQHTKEVVLMKGLEHIIGMTVNGVENLYLCDLSTINMKAYVNGRQGSNSLFNTETLGQYIRGLDSSSFKEQLIREQKIVAICKQEVQNFIKYDIATLLTYYQGNLHLGWIKNLNAYDTEWYLLEIIASLYETEEVAEEELQLAEDFILQEEESQEIEVDIPLEQVAKEISPLALKDLEHCGKRFYYNNILYPHPIYREDFTQRLAFGAICKILDGQMRGMENVKRYIYPLFPQWTETLKENMVETDPYKRNYRQSYAEFDGINYPAEMMRVQYLGSFDTKPINKTTKDKQIKIQKWLDDNKEEIQADAGTACMRCAYQMLCPASEFAVDRQGN